MQIAWPFVLLVLVALVQSVQAQSKLTYRFTIRSFLPAACFRDYAGLNRLWNYTHLGNNLQYPNDFTTVGTYIGGDTRNFTTTDANPVFKQAAKMCPIFQDIANGKFNGHPDFETDSTMYADGCSGKFDILTSPANNGTNCNFPRNITKIVEKDMVVHEDGLPKPRYCTTREFANDPRCGWRFPRPKSSFILAATSGPDSFFTWYRDSPEYNMRTGIKLDLIAINQNTFQFASSKFFPLAKNLSVGAGITPCLARLDRTMDCSNGGRVFPLASKQFADESINQVFSFTSEHHSFFQYRGTEKFAFNGDDDVWVYINEKLAVDVGGLHSAQDGVIDLSNRFVASQLGLQIGRVYALDMFHAERHTSASTFTITTGLTGGCNVLQSGKTAYAWTPATLAQDWKLVGGPTWGVVQGSTIKLTDATQQGTVGYAFLRQQINVGTGFVISFSFKAGSKGEGFVLSIQRDDIVDLNGGSGGHLGFRNTLNSLGIAFDFCGDRDTNPTNPACNNREMRMHFLDNGGSNNASSSITRKLRAPLYFPVVPNDGKTHTVVVNYFAQSPDWLEVLMDDDLLLQKRGINLDTVIGGRNAFVGFTASTGFTASNIFITDFSVSAVAIEDSQTIAIGFPSATDPPLNATADNRQFVSVDLKNFDFCLQSIQFGGFGNRALGVLTLVDFLPGAAPQAPPASNNARLLAADGNSGNATTNASTPTVQIGMTVKAEIVDNQNGQYSLRFRTTVPGTYSLQVFYGVGCFSNGTNTGDILANAPSSVCFSAYRNQSVIFTPVPPAPPTPDTQFADGLPQAAITGIGVAGGVVGFVGGMFVLVGMRMRSRWQRDKRFIEAGRAAVAERGVQYLGDQDLDALQNRLQQTLTALQAERAKRLREGDQQTIIDELNRQRGELQEQVRRLKIKMNGGDPNAPELPGPGLGTRIRKSFAANRVSRGFSVRMSRGLSTAFGFSPIQEVSVPPGLGDAVQGPAPLAAGNPMFRFSQAVAQKGPPPAPPQAAKNTVPRAIDV